jgi:hypothetical protein
MPTRPRGRSAAQHLELVRARVIAKFLKSEYYVERDFFIEFVAKFFITLGVPHRVADIMSARAVSDGDSLDDFALMSLESQLVILDSIRQAADHLGWASVAQSQTQVRNEVRLASYHLGMATLSGLIEITHTAHRLLRDVSTRERGNAGVERLDAALAQTYAKFIGTLEASEELRKELRSRPQEPTPYSPTKDDIKGIKNAVRNHRGIVFEYVRLLDLWP